MVFLENINKIIWEIQFWKSGCKEIHISSLPKRTYFLLLVKIQNKALTFTFKSLIFRIRKLDTLANTILVIHSLYIQKPKSNSTLIILQFSHISSLVIYQPCEMYLIS